MVWLARMAGAALAAVGAAVVLEASHLKPTDELPSKTTQVQPPVLLAIPTALANTFLRFALSEGTTIAWCIAALRGGTVTRLHQVWAQGTSVTSCHILWPPYYSTCSGLHPYFSSRDRWAVTSASFCGGNLQLSRDRGP